MAEREPIHTFLDDIKYQMVKGDNKRTKFYCSEIQIVNKNKQTLEKLERTRLHVRSEYNRQQVLLENQLGRLLQAKRELGLVSSRQSRRHSVPHNFHLASQSAKKQPTLSVTDKSSLQGDIRVTTKFNGDPLQTVVHANPTTMPKPVLQDLRRRSCDSTKGNQQGCLKIDPSIVHKGRRATIAEGLTDRNFIATLEF